MNQRLISMAAVMLAAMMTVTTNAQVTADTWGKRTLAPYTIDGNLSHHYSFILNP